MEAFIADPPSEKGFSICPGSAIKEHWGSDLKRKSIEAEARKTN
jgi:hypothetical protein